MKPPNSLGSRRRFQGLDPKEICFQSSEERDHWWEVDIAESQVSAAVEVVELVGVEPAKVPLVAR